MITIIGQCDLIARFCSNLADHHMVPLTTWIPPVPNRSITSIPCPCLIKIGLLGIRNLVKSRTVCIDNANGRLPIPDLWSGYVPTKKYQLIARLGPRWLKIPMSRSEGFLIGFTQLVNMYFPILVIGNSMLCNIRLQGFLQKPQSTKENDGK